VRTQALAPWLDRLANRVEIERIATKLASAHLSAGAQQARPEV
jgi:hypothetical protein